MRILIVTYCFGRRTGQALIGVYKRGLRVGHALCDRGHEVSFFCAGRDNYRDEMVERAERRMTFVDWTWQQPFHQGAERNRHETLAALDRIAPDVVVIGEAPLAGPLLELTLAAAERHTPVVCLDNAYGPDGVKDFCQRFGPMYDGIVLTGPSSFYAASPPAYLCQVPPFVDPSADAASVLASELGVDQERLVTVLAYDLSVETLAASILTKLNDERLGAIFVTPTVDTCRERLEKLPSAVRARTRVIEAPGERAYFGLLQRSDLVIAKLGFMQVTECLSLASPVIGVHFPGLFHLDLVPPVCRQFVHPTEDLDADEETLARARAFLNLDRASFAVLHDGSFDAIGRTAAFLESLPRSPRRIAAEEYGACGLSNDSLISALTPASDGCPVQIQAVRVSALREFRSQLVFSVVCEHEMRGQRSVSRFWHRSFRSQSSFESELGRVRDPANQRRLRWHSDNEWTLIEDDVGEAVLPALGDADPS